MRKTGQLRLALMSSVFLAAPLFAAPAMAQDAADDREQASDLGEVVVTARRREETLKDVPVAVTAVSAERLEQTGAADVTALQQQTPNATVQVARGTNSDPDHLHPRRRPAGSAVGLRARRGPVRR